jgi:hypothetical protein
VDIIIALPACQMILARRGPVFPRFVAGRTFQKQRLASMLNWAVPVFQSLERFPADLTTGTPPRFTTRTMDDIPRLGRAPLSRLFVKRLYLGVPLFGEIPRLRSEGWC